jgi:hypothetical protein
MEKRGEREMGTRGSLGTKDYCLDPVKAGCILIILIRTKHEVQDMECTKYSCSEQTAKSWWMLDAKDASCTRTCTSPQNSINACSYIHIHITTHNVAALKQGGWALRRSTRRAFWCL